MHAGGGAPAPASRGVGPGGVGTQALRMAACAGTRLRPGARGCGGGGLCGEDSEASARRVGAAAGRWAGQGARPRVPRHSHGLPSLGSRPAAGLTRGALARAARGEIRGDHGLGP